MRPLVTRREQGFTLVEVLFSALLLAVGIGGLIYAFTSAGQGSQTAHQQDVAATIATQQLEEMRSYPYSSLALSAQPTTLPDGRLVGSQFQANSGTDEDFVTAASGGIASTLTGSVGGTSYTAYRVVSWENQSCPVSLTGLNNELAKLQTKLASVEAHLTSLGGANGVSKAVTIVNALRGGAIGVLAGLLPGLNALLTSLNTTASDVSATLSTGLQSELSAIQSDIAALNLDGSGHLSITSIDPCHLPKVTLPDPSKLDDLANGLASVDANLSAALTDVNNTVSLGVVLSLSMQSSIASINTDLSAQNSSIGTDISTGGSLSPSNIGVVHTGLSNLKNVLNCVNDTGGCTSTGTHVMKRISVAVVISQTRTGVGPQQAVWMSSLVTDPQDGFL